MKFVGGLKILFLIGTIFCIVLLVGSVSPSVASQSDPDGPDDHGICPSGGEQDDGPEDPDDGQEDDDHHEDPVSVTGGKIFIPETDLELNGNGKKTGVAYLVFKRFFSSQSAFSGALGRGWSTTADIQVQETDVGVTIRTALGRKLNFVKDSDGAYRNPECGYSTLTKIDSDTFEWTLRRGAEYVFKRSGLATEPELFRVQTIDDRYGNRIKFEYLEFNDQSLGGLVSKPVRIVEPATNRFIRINWREYYNGQENVYLVESIEDSAGRKVSYEYDLAFNVFKGYDASLTRVTDPEGNIQRYEHVFEDTPDTTILRGFEVTDKKGNTTTYNFNEPYTSAMDYPDWNWNLRVESVVDPCGGTMSFVTDELLGVTVYTDKEGNAAVYDYSRMLLDSAVYADGRNKRYVYDYFRNLVKFTDTAGNEWNYEYDGLKNITKRVDPLGYSEEWTYESQYSKWIIKKDKNNNTWQRGIDETGSIINETDPQGKVIHYTYDNFGNLLTKTDAMGYTMVYTYDIFGNMASKTDAEENAWVYTYDTVGNLLSETDPRGNVVSYTYDKLGRMLTKTASGGENESFVYDAEGNLITQTDAQGNITRYTYDAMDRRIAVRFADNTEITYAYNAMGKLITEHKPNGTWTYGYDERNRRTSVTDPLNNTTTFTYAGLEGCGGCGSGDKIAGITDARGNTTTFTYDPLGRKILEKDMYNNADEYVYDANGNLIEAIDKIGSHTIYTYDNLNRLIGITNPLGEKAEIGYDANGNKTQVKDAKGNVSQYAYDRNNRLVQITDALSGQTRFGYDAAGNRITLTDAAGNHTEYDYESHNRLARESDAFGASQMFEYDNNGNLLKKINARTDEIAYEYDERTRIHSKTVLGDGQVIYTYDEAGNVLSATDPIGTRTFAYDNLDRLVSVTYPGGLALRYEYDAVGNRSKLIYPSGTTVTNAYDANNRLSGTIIDGGGTQKVFSFAYDAKGRRTQLSYPNNVITTYAYDPLDRVLSITTGKAEFPGSILDIRYTYDAAGNRIQRIDNAGTHAYAYDALNQLINVVYPDNTSQAYGFDAVGNRLSLNESGIFPESVSGSFNALNQLERVTSSTYNGGTLGSISGTWADTNIDAITVNGSFATIRNGVFVADNLQLVPGANTLNISAEDKAGNITQTTLDVVLDNTAKAVYTYDPDGNLKTSSVKGVTWTYTWNAESKLIRAASSSGKVIDYGYYDDGNLAFRQDSSGKVVYVYDGIHCIAEYDESGALLKEYVYGPNVDEVLCAQTPAGGVAYYHQDALQSVTVLTDGFANKITDYEYDVYGAVTKTTSATDNQILFTGRWLDSDTNLYYYRARWYDVSSGRFVSCDPIGVMGGVNLYGYCGNNSVKFIDPYGLLKWYGNWGGPKWSGGKEVSLENLSPEERNKLKAPIDDRDRCYMLHDYCYFSCVGLCDNKQRISCKKGCDHNLGLCLQQAKDGGDQNISSEEINFFKSEKNPWIYMN